MVIKALETLARWALPIGIAASGAQYAMYNVEGGQRAVIFDRVRGVLPGEVGEGTHFLLPWWQRAIIFDVRTKPRTISTSTASKDMQMVSLSLRVLSRPDYVKLAQIYQQLGADYDERVLPSIGNEVLKAVIAQFDPEQLITQRDFVRLFF
jgi:prohibitin 1